MKPDFRVILPNGQTRWSASRGRVEFNDAGKPKLSRGVAVDITARRNSEQEMRELRQELAHASRVTMLGQLSSSLAHELSQPLGAILHNAEAAELFLKMDPPDLEEITAILSDIRKDDHRAGEVINRMRVLLKRGKLETLPLDVTTLIEEVVALVREDAITRGVAIDTIIPSERLTVLGDRVQFQQVLLNLILNGMDALNEQKNTERRVTIRGNKATRALLKSPSATPGTASHPIKSTRFLNPFSRPNRLAWASAWPFHAQSWKPITDGFGRKTTRTGAPPSASPC